MFTIKYRSHVPADTQQAGVPIAYDTVEQLSGPYHLISQEVEKGSIVVYAHDIHGNSQCTFGPHVWSETLSGPPRPTLWVMNENGATVARYDL